MSQDRNSERNFLYISTDSIKSFRRFLRWFFDLPSSIKRLFFATCVVGVFAFLIEVSFIRFLNALMAGVGLIQGDSDVMAIKITGPILILLAMLRLGVGIFRFFLSGKLAQTWTHLQRESLVRRITFNKKPVTADEIQKYSYHAENGGEFFIILSMLFFNSVSAIATISYCFWLSLELSLIVVLVAFLLLIPFLLALRLLKKSVNRVFDSKHLMDRYFASMLENAHIMDTIDTTKIVTKNILESTRFAREMIKIDVIKGIKRNFPELIGISIVIILITEYRQFPDIKVSLLTTMVYLLVRLSQYLGNTLFALGQAQYLYKSIDVNSSIDLTLRPETAHLEVLKSGDTYKIEVEELAGRRIEFLSPGLVQLVGAPGSGKTTLLRHILGYLRDDPFRVTINSKSSQLFVKDMAYLGSAPIIYPESMLSNVLLFSASKSTLDLADKEYIQSVFPDLSVDILLEMHPAQLSSGQLQRLSFIQLAFSDRRIIMLDETFSSLGAEEKYLIKELQKKMPDSLIIFVSHNVEPGSLGGQFVELHRSSK